jgi:hypothetical protein
MYNYEDHNVNHPFKYDDYGYPLSNAETQNIHVPPVWATPEQEALQAEFKEHHSPRKSLHWYQWIVYTFVLVTCVAILIALYDAYTFVNHLHDTLSQLQASWEK